MVAIVSDMYIIGLVLWGETFFFMETHEMTGLIILVVGALFWFGSMVIAAKIMAGDFD